MILIGMPYTFFEMSQKGEQSWSHVYLRPDYHSVSNGYEYTIASNGASDYAPGYLYSAVRTVPVMQR